ncbi:Uncharacterised protein [Bordetella pertussis]|nr:Uncharacterised protein [Bordetella pertussis]
MSLHRKEPPRVTRLGAAAGTLPSSGSKLSAGPAGSSGGSRYWAWIRNASARYQSAVHCHTLPAMS